MTVVISPRAEAELEAIFDFGAQRWGLDRAHRYVDSLISAFDRIAARQVIWRPIDASIGIEGFRHRCGGHVIYGASASMR